MDIKPITKQEAIAAYEGNASALARALKITPSAVYQWPDGPIADVHTLKLRFVLKPEAFDADGNLIAQPPAQGHEPVRRCTAAPETGDAAETAPPVPMKKVA